MGWRKAGFRLLAEHPVDQLVLLPSNRTELKAQSCGHFFFYNNRSVLKFRETNLPYYKILINPNAVDIVNIYDYL